MPRRAIRWLLQELPDLVEQRVLDPVSADRLRSHYAGRGGEGRQGLYLILFGLLGAGLLGLGLTLLVAHNWPQMSRGARTGVVFGLLLLAQALAAWARWKRPGSRAWGEGTAAFLGLAFPTCLALTSQIYQVQADLPSFLMTVSLLVLPLVWLLESSAAAALFLAGVTGWVLSGEHPHPAYLLFWLLLLLGLTRIRSCPSGLEAELLLFLGGIGALLGVLPGLRDGAFLPALLAFGGLLSSQALSASVLPGRWAGICRRSLGILGFLGISLFSFLLGFRSFWEDGVSGKDFLVFLEPPAAFFLLLSLIALVLAWRKGGFPGSSAWSGPSPPSRSSSSLPSRARPWRARSSPPWSSSDTSSSWASASPFKASAGTPRPSSFSGTPFSAPGSSASSSRRI